MRIYTVSAYNIKDGYFVENAMFTSKKNALSSYTYVINHLIKKYNLDTGDIVTSNWIEGDKMKTTKINERFNVCFKIEETKSDVLKYLPN